MPQDDIFLPPSATHLSHPGHELQLESFGKFACNGCKIPGYGFRYNCALCKLNLHKHCMFTIPNSHNEFLGKCTFKKSTFKFLNQLIEENHGRNFYRCCEACAKPTDCEVDVFNLHPSCLNFPRKFHNEDLEFELGDEVLSKCGLCSKKKLKGSVTGNSGWLYASKCGDYNLHVFCKIQMLLDLLNDRESSSNYSFVERKGTNQPFKGLWKQKEFSAFKVGKVVKLFFRMLGDPTIAITLASTIVEMIT